MTPRRNARRLAAVVAAGLLTFGAGACGDDEDGDNIDDDVEQDVSEGVDDLSEDLSEGVGDLSEGVEEELDDDDQGSDQGAGPYG